MPPSKHRSHRNETLTYTIKHSTPLDDAGNLALLHVGRFKHREFESLLLRH